MEILYPYFSSSSQNFINSINHFLPGQIFPWKCILRTFFHFWFHIKKFLECWKKVNFSLNRKICQTAIFTFWRIWFFPPESSTTVIYGLDIPFFKKYFLCSTKVGTWYSMAKIHYLWQIKVVSFHGDLPWGHWDRDTMAHPPISFPWQKLAFKHNLKADKKCFQTLQ